MKLEELDAKLLDWGIDRSKARIFIFDETAAQCGFDEGCIARNDPLPDDCVHAIMIEFNEGSPRLEVHYYNESTKDFGVIVKVNDPDHEDFEPAFKCWI